MKLTIKAYKKINNIKMSESGINGEIKEIEIDFEPSYPWSDLDFWLTNSESTTVFDYAKMYITKRNKIKLSN